MAPAWKEIQALVAEGRRGEALEALQAYCESRVEARDGHLEAAKLSEQLGLFALAEREYGLVLRDEPRHPEALDALAALHEESGRWDRAARCLEALLEVAGDPRAVAIHLLSLYERMGERERVESLRQRCAENG